MPTKHALGFGNGRIMEHEDGTAAYIKTGEFTQAFRVNIADVRGFSVTRHGKVMSRLLHVLGNGTTLASVEVNHGTSELIEKWFQRHPSFNSKATPTTITPTPRPAAAAPAPSALVADELRKLAELRNEGILTSEEFDAQKAKLLGR
ncbi:SHOCT domain-containing protein [Rhodococcus sp. NPDC060090]|uniref:SHOCT domain-containing protein n=1 Tax=Rhodococcus sp. NPDC060090 TaxID=3347056 RepID=UPI00364D63F0